MKFGIPLFLALFATGAAFSEATKMSDSCCIPNSGHEIQDCQGVKGTYNLPASFDVRDCWKVFLTADFLYWQAREDNLAFGVTTDDTESSPIHNGHVINMDFKWHPGVKVGLGMHFPRHDNWDLFFEWTHLVSHNKDPLKALAGAPPFSSTAFIFPTLADPQIVSPGVGAKMADENWSLVYNTIDANLGRRYYSGKMLTFRPHVGLRGAWFKQNIDVVYVNVFGETQDILLAYKFNSWGIGPRVGVESNWLLGGGCRIFGDAAMSLLYTYFDVKHQNALKTLATGTIDELSDVKDEERNSQVRSNLETALGFGWGTYFDCNSWHIDLALGYEFQYWINANENLRFVDAAAKGVHVTGGDLALHGATFRLRLDF